MSNCRPTSFALFPYRQLLCGVLLITCATQVGCVQRRMTIRSNPPGARVIIDGDYEIGTTPVSTSFLYYGTREIKLIKDGYETLVVKQPVSPPWYQVPPIDFFSENFYPGELRDYHEFSYNLQPTVQVPTDVLLDRADGLRDDVRAGASLLPGQPPQPIGLPNGLPPSGGPPWQAQPGMPPPSGYPIGNMPPLSVPAQPGRYFPEPSNLRLPQ